jgi:hypothetical protein
MEKYKGRQVPELHKYKGNFIASDGRLRLPCVTYPIATNDFCSTVDCGDCILDAVDTGKADLQLIVDYLIEKNYLSKSDGFKLTLDNYKV